jgi:hypothetical protein
MTTATLDPDLFRKLFGEFADEAAYPDPVLQVRWDEATGYVSPDSGCGFLTDPQRVQALNYMTAHLCRLNRMVTDAATEGGITGVVLSAQVDKVQVQLQAPPARGMWGHWLAQTPYGISLSAFLAAKSAGGFTVGGNPERAAFRKVGGVW